MASLLTVALHGKLEYFTDILRTLLSDLVAQYVAKNPKLMLRRSVWVSEAMGDRWLWTAGARSCVRTSGVSGSADPPADLASLRPPFLSSQDRDRGGEAAHQLDVHLPLHFRQGEGGRGGRACPPGKDRTLQTTRSPAYMQLRHSCPACPQSP